MLLALSFIDEDMMQKRGVSTTITVAILTWFFVAFVPWIMRRYETRLDTQEKRHVDAEKVRHANYEKADTQNREMYERSLSQVLEHARTMYGVLGSRLETLENGMGTVTDELRGLGKQIAGITGKHTTTLAYGEKVPDAVAKAGEQ